MILVLLCSSLLASLAAGDITGSNPAPGTCVCLNVAGVNVRDAPPVNVCTFTCGTVIGSAQPPQCYKTIGAKQTCPINGINYEFHGLEYGGRNGYIAGDYLDFGNDVQCGGGGGGACGQVEKVYRSEWGARPPAWYIPPLPNKPVGMGFVHHTVTPFCYTKDECMREMRNIQNYHMDANGWPDIGYNWLVGEDGRAYEGRGWDTVGAHTYGYNDIAVAVSAIGDFTGRVPNAAAQAAIQNIFDCAVQLGILGGGYEMFGHRDGYCTACPGDSLYPLIRTWPHYSFRTIPRYC